MEEVLWKIMAASAITITMEDFFATFLKKKIIKTKYVFVWMLFWGYHVFLMSGVEGALGHFVGNTIGLSVVCLLSYQATLIVKEMMVVFAISLSGMAEGMVVVILILFKGNITGNVLLYSLIAKIVFWGCIRVLTILYRGKIETSQKKSYLIILSMTVIGNIMLLVGTLKLTEKMKNVMVSIWGMILVFLLLVFDIIIFKLYVMYQEKNEIKRMKQEYANQIEMYDRQMCEKQKIMDEVRRTKHDMKNNMIYLQNLMKTDPEEAKKYLEKFIGNTIERTDEFSKSGNFAVDSLLNYKNMVAKNKNIRIELEQQIPIKLPYESSDICVILGNLLDNAIEASENSENKEIKVYIGYAKNKLKIRVKNYYMGEVKKDGSGNFMSKKEDKQNHGIGLKSVNKIVESYDGFIEIRAEDSVFQVNILM